MLNQRMEVLEAKNHLSQILKSVQHDGASYVITRQGRPVAEIVPFQQEPEMKRKEAIEDGRK